MLPVHNLKSIRVMFIKGNFCIWLVLLLVVSCTVKSKQKYSSIPGYDISKPTTIHLRGELDEISGLYYYKKDTSVFSIIDEAGYLYKIFLRKKVEIQKWKFSKNGDFEDISMVDSTFYALKSNGDLTSFKFFSLDSVQEKKYNSPLSGKNEFEGLFYDSLSRQLVLLCKDCEADKKKSLSAYSFNVVSRVFSDTPYFVLDVENIAEDLGAGKMKFKPSGIAVHPKTRELYIISSVNKALVIAGPDGKIKDAYQLDPSIFKQPEGITFTPWGDLLISNEAAEVGSPNILIFKYKPKNDAKVK